MNTKFTIERWRFPRRIRGVLMTKTKVLLLNQDVDIEEQKEIENLMKQNEPAIQLGGFVLQVAIRR